MTTIPDYRLEPPPAPKLPSCPVCGNDNYDYVIEDISGDIIGCSECVRCYTVYEYAEKLEMEKM